MKIPTHIKNIIFDFGGVILNIDYKLTEQAFVQLGLKDFSSLYSQAAQKDLFNALEKGLISPAEFRSGIRNYLSRTVSDSEIDTAWNAMLLDLPEERVQLLDRIKNSYRTFLLSNTNAIHFDSFSAYMKKRFSRDVFAECFETAYVSHRVHMRKPDAEIFEFVLSENKLDRKETLFIDDSIQHIESADKLGIQTVFLEKGRTILDLFS